MPTTDLNLQEQGSLNRPGVIGRLARLIFGFLCLWYLFGLYHLWPELTDDQGIKGLLWNGIVPSLVLISYVINIGWSKAWKKYPAFISLLILVSLAVVDQTDSGNFQGQFLANGLFWWTTYLYSHLGISFILSAAIATPGCEMRALPHLYSLITGVPTKEHHCPIGPLHPIDSWEAKLRK